MSGTNGGAIDYNSWSQEDLDALIDAGGDPAAAAEGRRRGLATVTLAELLAEPAPTASDDLVAGLLPRVGLAGIAGARKSFKTFFALQVALAIAGGAAGVLGRAVGRHGPVLIVEEEGARSKFRDRVAAMLAGLELDARQLDLHFALHTGLGIDQAASWERLRGSVAAIQPVAAVFDPLVYLHSQDENDNAAMGAKVMRPIVRLAAEHDLLALVLHHMTKPGQQRPARASDRIRGAGAIAAATDANLVFERSGASGVRLQGEYRDAEDVDLYYEFDPARMILVEAAGPIAVKKVAQGELVAFLDETGVAGAAQIAERFGVSRNTAKEAALSAAEAGLIDHFIDGPRGHRFLPLEGGVNAPG